MATMLTPQQVADFFRSCVDEQAGDYMTHLRLQKLVYYAQAWHLAATGRPLFHEDFQAWVHGPVLLSLHREYRGYKWDVILSEGIAPPLMDDETRTVLSDVWANYGQYSAKALEEMTHSEAPWIDARSGCAPHEKCATVIPKEAMQDYYKRLRDMNVAVRPLTPGERGYDLVPTDIVASQDSTEEFIAFLSRLASTDAAADDTAHADA
jgi:uncharacterized phage-associated protein